MDEDSLQLARRVRLLEQKIDLIMQHLGLEFEDRGGALASPLVIDLVRQGSAIRAIKVHRQETGVGLKEAKDVVDELVARHKQGML